MSSAKSVDLFVIGGGSGGVRAARLAASNGAKVALAEERFLGGTCVNVGCVPKKLFSYAAHYAEDFVDANGFGWAAKRPDFDWSALKRGKDAEIGRLNGIYRGILERAGAELVEARAKLLGDGVVEAGGAQFRADKILVAVGGEPTRPPIDGAEFGAVSDDMFHLERLPRRAVIVGGGYIACEFASILAGLGVETTLAHRGPELLKRFDADVRRFITGELEKKGVQLRLGDAPRKITGRDGRAASIEFAGGGAVDTDLVLLATGRRPKTLDIGLEDAGVKLARNGAVLVDDEYRTSAPDVFAVGDAIDRIALTPVAIAEAAAFTRRQFSGDTSAAVDYENVATAVFCGPNIGCVGMTEEEAQAAGIGVDVYLSDFRQLRHSLSGSDERSLAKLVVGKSDGKVRGVHLVGSNAGEIIQGFAVALKLGATKADLDSTVAVHPTMAEELVTMSEPVR